MLWMKLDILCGFVYFTQFTLFLVLFSHAKFLVPHVDSASMTKLVKLYSYWRSSSAWRVRVLLALKGIDYQYVAVPLLTNAQSATDFSALNPMHQVPCLVVSEEGKEDVVISQSLAIIDYIENTFEGPSLFPKGTCFPAYCLQSCAIAVACLSFLSY